MFWGISEALDLFQEYLDANKDTWNYGKATKMDADGADADADAHVDGVGDGDGDGARKEATEEPPESLNILLFGAGDARHLIKTIAKLYTHRMQNGSEGVHNAMPHLNFFVIEGCVEILTRTMALLGIAFEDPQSFNLLNKVHLFMDIYGNTLIRPSSHHYLVAKAKTLLKMFSDDDKMKELIPWLDISGLKYRERDSIGNSFNFWLPKEGNIFNITEYWDIRSKKHLGQRYDHREGAFDWDLSMNLKVREGKQICSQEYRYWRETGIAFTFPEYEQSKPNKTISAGIIRNGDRYLNRGYVGDIQTGPYCPFGLKTSDEKMLRSSHGENDYRATDITERNLLELFHELQTKTPYVHDPEISRKYGSVKLLMGKCLTWNECDMDEMQEYDKPWIPVEGITVRLLSTDELLNLHKWINMFDIAFVGHNYFTLIGDSFINVLRKNALLIFETKFMTLARQTVIDDCETKLRRFATNGNMKPVINYNAINGKYSVMKFKKV